MFTILRKNKNVSENINRKFYKSIKFSFFNKSPVIDTQTLYKIMTDEKINKNLKIVDCTFCKEDDDEISQHLFEQEIPNSIYINPMDLSENKHIKTITKESLDELDVVNPYNMPSNEEFITKMKNFNIKKSDLIICYDRFGVYSSARLWFMFKLFGLKNVYVLDGGFNKWKKDKFPVDKINKTEQSKSSWDNVKDQLFSYKKDESKLLNTNKILYLTYDILKRKSKEEIIDTRSPERFKGTATEPFPVIRTGTMLNGLNLYYKSLLDENSCLLPENKIKEVLKKSDIDLELSSHFVFFSGLGVSACVGILAFDVIGKFDKIKFYPGGWFEMGNVLTTGNNILEKLREYETRSPAEQTDEIFGKMGPNFQERCRKQIEREYKLREVKDKNFEYLKRKNKIKQKEVDGDYSSPDEMF